MKMIGPFSGVGKGTQWDCDEKMDINPHINYQPHQNSIHTSPSILLETSALLMHVSSCLTSQEQTEGRLRVFEIFMCALACSSPICMKVA